MSGELLPSLFFVICLANHAFCAALLDDYSNVTTVSEPAETTTKVLTIPTSDGKAFASTSGATVETTTKQPIYATTEEILDVTTTMTRDWTTTEETAYSWNCTFDHGWCGMTNSANDNFDWTRFRGQTGSARTGPSEDHTGNEGFYAFIETSSPRRPGEVATLTYQFPKHLNHGCLSLFYHMYGDAIGSLEVELKDSSHTRQSWRESGNQGDKWLSLHISIQTPINMLVIQGRAGQGYRGDLAVDDLMITSAECPSLPINCSFQHDLCGWNQDLTDSFDWQRIRGKTESLYTGPNSGRLGSDDTYLYIDSSAKDQGDSAVITYTLKKPVDSGCFSFYYNMYGRDMGSLEVSINSNDTLWYLSGSQGQKWIQKNLTIQEQIHSINIKAVVGSSFEGDIAIDDLTFTTSPCYLAPPPSINCTFDVEVCGWEQSERDDFDWSRPISGSTPSSYTGPSADHTTGKGKYIYIETSRPRKEGEVASFEYTFASAVDRGCLSFYYHMYGSAVGSLSVTSIDLAGNTKQLWSLSGRQSNKWLPLHVPITEETLKLSINGKVGDDVTGDIAIDDISFSEFSCPGAEVKLFTCPKPVTVVAGALSRTGVFNISTGGESHQVTLPIGRYPYTFINKAGRKCALNVTIYDSRVVQRMMFEARYPTDCSILSDPVAKEMVMSSASLHRGLMKGFCARDCSIDSPIRPKLSCKDDELVIRWPTTRTFLPDVTSIPFAVKQRLSNNLANVSQNTIKIVIGTRIPPVVYPTPNKDGAYIGVALNLECNNGFPMDVSKVTCE